MLGKTYARFFMIFTFSLCLNACGFFKKEEVPSIFTGHLEIDRLQQLSPQHQQTMRKLGQMLIVTVPNKFSKEPRQLDVYAKELATHNIGGVLLMNYNLKDTHSMQDVRTMVETLQYQQVTPLFVAVDQEGGKVRRLREEHGFSFYPRHSQIENPQHAYEIASLMGNELSEVGVNWNFAPVLDVNSNPKNPIIGQLGRAFSDKPNVVGEFGIEFIRGLQEQGVMATAKHFPGHGDSYVDSHLESVTIPKSMDQLRAVELIPFKAAIEHGVKTVMVGHMLLPNAFKHKDQPLPASVNKQVINTLLKGELGFNGIVVSDDHAMAAITDSFSSAEAAELSVAAGVTMIIVKAGEEITILNHFIETLSKKDFYAMQIVAAIDAAHEIITREKYELSDSGKR